MNFSSKKASLVPRGAGLDFLFVYILIFILIALLANDAERAFFYFVEHLLLTKERCRKCLALENQMN